LLVEYDSPEHEIISHLDEIKHFIADGLRIDEKHYGIENIYVAQELHPSLLDHFELALIDVDSIIPIQFNCALTRTDLVPTFHTMVTVKRQKSTENTTIERNSHTILISRTVYHLVNLLTFF